MPQAALIERHPAEVEAFTEKVPGPPHRTVGGGGGANRASRWVNDDLSLVEHRPVRGKVVSS